MKLEEGGNWTEGKARKGECICKACRSAYSKKWHAENREKQRAYNKKWYAKNREKRLAYWVARYAVKRDAVLPEGQSFSDAAEATKHIYAEARRLTEETGVEHHVDHIVPCAQGGLHAPENLQIVPAHVNYAKAAKENDEFLDNWLSGKVPKFISELPPDHQEVVISYMESRALELVEGELAR